MRIEGKENKVLELATKFAVRIVKFYKHFSNEKKEFVLSKQLLRSGTSVGANIFEAQDAQSKADFGSKMNIALKEANESYYWIKLLHESDYISKAEYDSLQKDILEIRNILSAIVKTCFDTKY